LDIEGGKEQVFAIGKRRRDEGKGILNEEDPGSKKIGECLRGTISFVVNQFYKFLPGQNSNLRGGERRVHREEKNKTQPSKKK